MKGQLVVFCELIDDFLEGAFPIAQSPDFDAERIELMRMREAWPNDPAQRRYEVGWLLALDAKRHAVGLIGYDCALGRTVWTAFEDASPRLVHGDR